MRIIDLSCHKKAPPTVATLGFFDGVHLGHRYLIDQVKNRARRLQLPSAVITFPTHPRKVLEKAYQPALLCGFDEKIARLRASGIDYCFVLPFTQTLSRLTAKDFIRQVLKEKIGARAMLVGHDHRFGRLREEGFSDYLSYGKAVGIDFIKTDEYRRDGINVSSSKIRQLLSEGAITRANQLLDYRYTISGKIVEGYKVGRAIGFPTANVQSWEKYKVIPALGVYAVLARVDESDIVREGMLYIGARPTLSDAQTISVEVNIFDFDGDLYNRSLTVEFIDFIRPDETFSSLDLLVKQIKRDKETVKNRLKEITR